jgi:hypothetical protein
VLIRGGPMNLFRLRAAISPHKRISRQIGAAGIQGESAEGGTSSAAQPAGGRPEGRWKWVQ